MHDTRFRPLRGFRRASGALYATALAMILAGFGPLRPAGAAEVVLFENGAATLPIVVATNASEHVRAAAATLSSYLERMTGAAFEITEGDGTSGLAIGLLNDYLPPVPPPPGTPGNIPDRDGYLLRTHADGLWVIGMSDKGVENAVWDFLHRLGYRQYFPGTTWEIVPRHDRIALELNAAERPDFFYRSIWAGFGRWPVIQGGFLDWQTRNRMQRSFILRHGHSFDAIYMRLVSVFEEHPEYLALVDGERVRRGGQKFCLSNLDLRKVLVDFSVDTVRKHPEYECVSIDPSDGGHWCECDDCAAMGSISDRIVILANEVAAGINADPEAPFTRYVGINIYNEHSDPPSIDVDSRVIGMSTTAFIRSKLSHDQIMSGWRERGATVGVYVYLSVMQWDHDNPGKAAAADPLATAKRLVHFHDQGARLLTAESSDNWGPCGLGYYVATRVLWDISEAERVDDIRREFIDNCFGDAAPVMETFYRTIDGSTRPVLSEHLLGRMYRLLDEARTATTDPAVQARLRALILYTRQQEMLRDYNVASTDVRERTRLDVLRYLWRMRDTSMTHTLGQVYAVLGGAYKRVDIPKGWGAYTPEAECPWKDPTPITDEEVARFLHEGIAANRTLDFEPVAFSDDLVPAAPLGLPPVETGSFAEHVFYNSLTLYVWKQTPEDPVTLNIQGGYFGGKREPGPGVHVKAWAHEDPTGGMVVDDDTLPADRTPHPWVLETRFPGLHRVTIKNGGNAGGLVTWEEGAPVTFCPDTRRTIPFYGAGTAYFYVPRGTPTVAGYCARSARGAIRDPDGNVVGELKTLLPDRRGYFAIPVPEGMDGRLWQLDQCAHDVVLLTVPPSIARNERELLLPREVVAADTSD